MSATTVTRTDARAHQGTAVTFAQRDKLALEIVLAVVLGVGVAMLATWGVLATMALHMSF
jgi:hypothetical protein